MNILVILTGGTIGSKVTGKIIDTDQNSTYTIINMYYERFGTDCLFKVVQPFHELSENFTLDTVNMLARLLAETDTSSYDGIIITHGSDTVAYTCAFISYMFRNSRCPIVFTVSNYPPENPESNALNNFRGSVKFIESRYAENGVFFVCKNPYEDTLVYLGTRINEADCFSDRFSPFGNVPFGRISDDRFIPESSTINPSATSLAFAVQANYYTVLKSSALLLKSFTGMDYSLIDIESRKISAIVNIMYHSSTACTSGKETSITDFIKKCRKNNIDVYCISCRKSDEIYSSAEEIARSGAYLLYNISYEAAYAKAVLAYSINNKNLMQENIFFEHIL